jgi:hypothetical protein
MRTKFVALGSLALFSVALIGHVAAGELAVAANARLECKCPGNDPNCRCPPNTIVKPNEEAATKSTSDTAASKKPSFKVK